MVGRSLAGDGCMYWNTEAHRSRGQGKVSGVDVQGGGCGDCGRHVLS